MLLHEKAFAKINLSLHVTGRRADGYHLLSSLVVFAESHDLLQAEEAEGLSLEIDGPFADALSPGAPNLVTRAAHALAEAAGISARAKLRLTKNLPVGAGIGGGSADAAAALRLLCRMWDIALPPEEMLRLAVSLGADVPVCLTSRTSSMSGIGEVVQQGPRLPPWGMLLVNPCEKLATAEVFRHFHAAYDAPILPLGASENPLAWLAAQRNSLQGAAMALTPVIGEILSALAVLPGCGLARMSGSGATCFALFEEVKAAKEAAGILEKAHPEWWVMAAKIL